MRYFSELYQALDRSTKTNEKIRALESYFRSAPPVDAAWALYFILGNTVPRPVSTRVLREWVAEAAGLPLWLLEESYAVVGDLAETFALILRPGSGGVDVPLSRLVEETLLPLSQLEEGERKRVLFELWSTLDQAQLFLVMKLITGSFRVGVQKTLLSRALSKISGLPQAQLAHRLMGGFAPTPAAFEKLVHPEAIESDPGQPYPFCLASPLEAPPEELGACEDWLAEWKWDGIRAQCIRRAGQMLIWSRGEEVITETFPEIAEALSQLPSGTVVDGEIVAWDGERPLPFGELQRRLGRKRVGAKMIEQVPTHFIAYDLLERNGTDFREATTERRRAELETLIRDIAGHRISISPLIQFANWSELAQLREQSRERRSEGCMLKRRDAPYGSGRKRGLWWKWKIDPHTCDAVLIYAERGHGRRAGLYTDYTFAVWKGEELVPIAKAYSGLTDAEFAEINRFIRDHTLTRFGPVVSLEPLLVFELSFDDIRLSKRHKAGLALRFPRMSRIRRDKLPKDADTIESLLALLPSL
ncbi:MAG: ATP-dependent DNA ligase [Bdellovibrionota bacterium]